MYALKESPLKMLFGTTSKATTVPGENIPIPQRLKSALDALDSPEIPLPRKQAFTSALNSGPFYEDGHLILANSFNKAADAATDVWNERIFKRLAGSRLVDIQRIWEGYDGTWLAGTPLLLRFETIDVVLSPSRCDKSLQIWTGYLDTNASVYKVRNNSAKAKELNNNSCLKWLSYRKDAGLTGKRVQSIHLLSLMKPLGISPEKNTRLPLQHSSLQVSVPRCLLSLSLDDGQSCTFINKEGNLILCA